MNPDWLTRAIIHLSSIPAELRHEELIRVIVQHIHEALEIMEVGKYATPESRVEFIFTGATEEDLRKIRAGLTAFENLIVEIRNK